MSVSICYRPVQTKYKVLKGGSAFKDLLECVIGPLPRTIGKVEAEKLRNAVVFAEGAAQEDIRALIREIERVGDVEVYAEY